MASDVLLRKTTDKFCDFPVNFEGRPARCIAFFLDGHDVLAVLNSIRVLFSKPL